MHLRSNSGESTEIAEKLLQQLDYIRTKRSVRISLKDFAPTTTLSSICETLSLMLAQQIPPIQLERVFASDNNILDLPAEFYHLCGSHLRTLDLHNNMLSSMPETLALACPNLEMLDLSNNNITHLPERALLSFKSLRLLLLKNNRITHLPHTIGEMISLETLPVLGNPLIYPSIDKIKSMPGGINDLKAFLVSNSASLDPKVNNQMQDPQKVNYPSTPALARTRSLSDTRSRSLKASRRMGLIINSNKVTPDKSSPVLPGEATTPSKPERKLLLPDRERADISTLNFDGKNNISLHASSVKASVNNDSAVPELQQALGSNSPPAKSSVSGTQRNGGASKDRENSPEEADAKPVAYFRRLSVLCESPSDSNSQPETKAKLPPNETATTVKHPLQSSKLDVAALKHTKRKGSTSSNLPNSSQTNTSQPHGLRLGIAHERSVIVKVSRKILFSFSELHLSIKRFAGFCGDKKLSTKIVRLIHSSKEHIDNLVESMEAVEAGEENQNVVVNSLHSCINSFKTILSTISNNLGTLVARIDACFIRMVLLTLFGSLHELQNAHKLLTDSSNMLKSQPSLTRNPSSMGSSSVDLKGKYTQSSHGVLEEISLETPSISSATEAVATVEEIDERLYQTISLATSNAQVVFSELTKTISKSAIATANTNSATSMSPGVAIKFKDLTHVCMTSMEITKRLVGKLSIIRSNQDTASRRSFWDDINSFLKAVIQTFSAVKDIMKDAPIFNEVRLSMANLTKTTKELTIILEASSYKAISDAVGSSPNNNMWHMSNGPPKSVVANPPQPPLTTPGSVTGVRTPLVAAVGTAAAQALLAQQDAQHSTNTHKMSSSQMPPLNIPPLMVTDPTKSGLHTAPVQSMEQYYAKNINPFDRI